MQLKHLEVVDVFSVVDSAHVLHQEVQLAASFPRHVDGQGDVPFKNPHSRLQKNSRFIHRHSSLLILKQRFLHTLQSSTVKARAAAQELLSDEPQRDQQKTR